MLSTFLVTILLVDPSRASRMETDLFYDSTMIENSTWKHEFEIKYQTLNETSNLTVKPEVYEESPLWMQFIFCQSPYLFGLMGLFIFFLISIPVSLLTGGNSTPLSSKLFVYYKELGITAYNINNTIQLILCDSHSVWVKERPLS